jgi:hypothetical protein
MSIFALFHLLTLSSGHTMKITAPKIADQYFHDTEHAVKHAYVGLASCWRHVEDARKDMPPPIEKERMLHYLPPETPEEKARVERSLASYKKYFELKISEAMFAGFILEAAYWRSCSTRPTRRSLRAVLRS